MMPKTPLEQQLAQELLAAKAQLSKAHEQIAAGEQGELSIPSIHVDPSQVYTRPFALHYVR